MPELQVESTRAPESACCALSSNRADRPGRDHRNRDPSYLVLTFRSNKIYASSVPAGRAALRVAAAGRRARGTDAASATARRRRAVEATRPLSDAS